MSDQQTLLLKTHLKQLRLLTISAECEKLAHEAAERNQRYETYLLRLTELEVANRQTNALYARIKAAGFPVPKDFDTFDFSAKAAAAKHEQRRHHGHDRRIARIARNSQRERKK